MSVDPGAFISGALRHEDVDVAREYGSAMCTIWSLVKVGDRTLQSRGSGFLVRCAGQACVLTNAHVLPNREALERSTVKFIVPMRGCSSEVTLCPEKLFMTSPKPRPARCACKYEMCTCSVAAKASALSLDYTACAISAEGLHLRKSVPVPLNGTKPLQGNGIYFIHQIGEHLKCAKEQIEAADEFRILTMSASFPGSSGSPVFNLDRELIGLHRAGGCNANISMEIANAGIGSVIAPCLAVPTRAIARNMRLQMSVRDILDDILHAFLSEDEESQGSPEERESSSEEEKEIAHYAPVNQLAVRPRQPRYLLAKWGFEIFYERSNASGGQITITRIVAETQAARRLEVGDVIRTVNGVAIDEMDIVLMLTYLQVSKLLLAIDRLSPSSGFLMLLTNRRRVDVLLDTPQLTGGGAVHGSEEDPRAMDRNAAARGKSDPEEGGSADSATPAQALHRAVDSVVGLLQVAAGGGNQAAEADAPAVESAETGSEEGNGAGGEVVEGDAGQGEDEGTASAQAAAPGEGRSPRGGDGGGTPGGGGEGVVVQAFGGPRYVVERLGVQLGKGSPGRLRVVKVARGSWCRQLMAKGDEVVAIAGRSLQGMKVARVLELLNREGVRLLMARACEGVEPEQSDEVWTVELASPPPGAEQLANARMKRGLRASRRGAPRVKEYMGWARHGQSPAVFQAGEPLADAGRAGGVEGGRGGGEEVDGEARHVVERWGLELEKGGPGRLRVAKVREESMARGEVREGDEILAVNRRSLRGVRVRDALEALGVGRLTLALERVEGGAARGLVVELHALKIAARQAAENQRRQAAGAAPQEAAEASTPPGIIFAGAIGNIIQRATAENPRAAPQQQQQQQQKQPPQQTIAVPRWGLELGGGQPGRLRVCGVRNDGAARGKVRVGDVLLSVNSRTLKGMAVTELLALLDWERPVVVLERAVRKAALVDYWVKEQHTIRLGADPDAAQGQAPPAPDSAAPIQETVRGVVQRVVADAVKKAEVKKVKNDAVKNAEETHAVPRWELVIRRGQPGRMVVVSVGRESAAAGKLQAGDQITAVAGKALQGLRVQEVLSLLGQDCVQVALERGGQSAGRCSVELSGKGGEASNEGRGADADAAVAEREERDGGAPAPPGSAGGRAGGDHDKGSSEGSAERAGRGKHAADADGVAGQGQRAPVGLQASAAAAVGTEEEHLAAREEAVDVRAWAEDLVASLAGNAANLAERRVGASGEFKVPRWGIELVKGTPGQLKVWRVRGRRSLAFGRVYEDDDIVGVDGLPLKGMRLAEVLDMLARPRVVLRLERAVGAGGSCEYWKPAEVQVELVDRVAEAAAREEAERVAGEVVEEITAKALLEHRRRFKVERWGVWLRRGAPGRLRVTLVREDSVARGKLQDGDDIVAVDGAPLGSMQVEEALERLDAERVKVAIEREQGVEEGGKCELEVDLQSYPRRFNALPDRILGSAIEGLCDVRGKGQPAAPQAPRQGLGSPAGEYVVAEWGLVLRKGSPGSLRVSCVRAESVVAGTIQEGDEIVAVDGRAFQGMRLAQALEGLRRRSCMMTVVRQSKVGPQRMRVRLNEALREVAKTNPEEAHKQQEGEVPCAVKAPVAVTRKGDKQQQDVAACEGRVPKRRPLSEGGRVVSSIVEGIVDHAFGIVSARGAAGSPTNRPQKEAFRVDRWGVLLAKGGAGRMKVLKSEKESTRGLLREGDMVLMVNGVGFKGKKIADVLEMMQAPTLRVLVDRCSADGRWRLTDVHLDAEPRTAPGAQPESQPMRATTPAEWMRDIVQEIVAGVCQTHAVKRWGFELRRAAPGRLKVCQVNKISFAFGRLQENDEVVAVNGRELRGMMVCEVLDAMDAEVVSLTVERRSEGPGAAVLPHEVQLRSLQSIAAIVRLSVNSFSGAGREEARRSHLEEVQKRTAVAHVISDLVDAAVVRHRVQRWGFEVRRGPPGRLTVHNVDAGGRACEKLGLGDEIVAVDGQALQGITVNEALGLLRKREIKLTVERLGDTGRHHAVDFSEPEDDAAAYTDEETEPSRPTMAGFMSDIVQQISASTAQFATAHGQEEAAPRTASDAVKRVPREYFGEGLKLTRSSPSVVTVQRKGEGWDDLMDGDEIVALNGETLSGVKTSEVKQAMFHDAPTLTIHRRVLSPGTTTFWKWMLPAEVRTVQLPRAMPEMQTSATDKAYLY